MRRDCEGKNRSALSRASDIVSRIVGPLEGFRRKGNLSMAYKLAQCGVYAFHLASALCSADDRTRNRIAVYSSYWNLYCDHIRMDAIYSNPKVAEEMGELKWD